MSNASSIPIHNIFYMLSYAYQVLRQEHYQDITTEAFDNALDMFAAILDKGIALQLKRGLHRAYVDEKASLAVLRGKLDLRGTIQHRMNQRRQLVCVYDEYSEDNELNRILKTTALKLIFSPHVKKRTKSSLKSNLLFFSNVAEIDVSAIRWSGLRYNSNNATYRMLMSTCYLVIQSLLLSTRPGQQRMATFADMQTMSRLYERFILEYYKHHYSWLRPTAKQISWQAEGQEDYLPAMRADVVLTSGKKRLIIDAKYYSTEMQSYYDVETIRNAHLYQIYTYVKNEDAERSGEVSGLLLYAKTEDSRLPFRRYTLGGNAVSVAALDLNRSFRELQVQLGGIIDSWLG